MLASPSSRRWTGRRPRQADSGTGRRSPSPSPGSQGPGCATTCARDEVGDLHSRGSDRSRSGSSSAQSAASTPPEASHGSTRPRRRPERPWRRVTHRLERRRQLPAPSAAPCAPAAALAPLRCGPFVLVARLPAAYAVSPPVLGLQPFAPSPERTSPPSLPSASLREPPASEHAHAPSPTRVSDVRTRSGPALRASPTEFAAADRSAARPRTPPPRWRPTPPADAPCGPYPGERRCAARFPRSTPQRTRRKGPAHG